MLLHEFMQRWMQLFSYLDNGYLHRTMELPTVQGKEQTNLPCIPQGASVQVQRQTRLFCHLHCAKREENWPQLRHAPIKFGWFIKLYNINVKVLYKQADMGFAAEAGYFFWGGERGCFAPKKGVMLHPRATDFWGKKGRTFLGGRKEAFCPKKGCSAPSAGYGFREKNPPQAQYVL